MACSARYSWMNPKTTHARIIARMSQASRFSSQQKGDDAGSQEDNDEKIEELPQQNQPGRTLFDRRQEIGAVNEQALLSLRLGQAAGPAPQQF